MFYLKFYLAKSLLVAGIVTVTLVSYSCANSTGKNIPEEDTKAKALLQGVWNNELEGNTIFYIKGDSIFFNDSLSTPAPFYVRNDTLVIKYHEEVHYPIKSLTEHSLTFINNDGDEVELTKSSSKYTSQNNYVAPNQGKRIKKDSILNIGDKHFHAYTQVNPTTYKVYRQSTNNDGLSVESAYLDNIVYVALYNGQKKLFGQDFKKRDFAKYVPKSYLSQAVLSDILIDSGTNKGVRFVAILSIPDSYTTYRVNIDISDEGKKSLSVNI